MISSSQSPHDRARQVVGFAFFTVFLDLVGFGIIIPFFSLYVEAMGQGAAMAGIVISCFSATQFIATPILGRMSDRYGRRPVILVSLAGNALSMALFAAAVKLGLFWLLFLSRITAGATAGNLAACQAAIADVTRSDDRTKAMGRLGAGIGLGIALGPWLGGVLSGIGAWAPPLAASALAIADLVGVFLLMPETNTARIERAKAARGSFKDALTQPGVPLVLALYFATFLYMSNINVTVPLMAHARVGWGSKESGNVFALFGAIMIVIQGLLIGRLTRAVGAKRLVALGSISSAVGLLALATAHSAAALIVGVAFLGIGLGVVVPCISTIASERATAGRVGEILGYAQSSGGAARTLGPAMGGFLYEHLSQGAPFFVGAASALVALTLALAVRPVLAPAAPPVPHR